MNKLASRRHLPLLLLLLLAILALSSANAFAGAQTPDSAIIQILPDETEPTTVAAGGEYNARSGAPVALWGLNDPVRPGSPAAMAHQ